MNITRLKYGVSSIIVNIFFQTLISEGCIGPRVIFYISAVLEAFIALINSWLRQYRRQRPSLHLVSFFTQNIRDILRFKESPNIVKVRLTHSLTKYKLSVEPPCQLTRTRQCYHHKSWYCFSLRCLLLSDLITDSCILKNHLKMFYPSISCCNNVFSPK